MRGHTHNRLLAVISSSAPHSPSARNAFGRRSFLLASGTFSPPSGAKVFFGGSPVDVEKGINNEESVLRVPHCYLIICNPHPSRPSGRVGRRDTVARRRRGVPEGRCSHIVSMVQYLCRFCKAPSVARSGDIVARLRRHLPPREGAGQRLPNGSASDGTEKESFPFHSQEIARHFQRRSALTFDKGTESPVPCDCTLPWGRVARRPALPDGRDGRG